MDVSRYIGIPFAEHGRTEKGLDCYGLVRVVMMHFYGISTKDYDDYQSNRPKDCAEIIRGEQRKPEWVKVPNPLPGDLALFNILGMPAHCGIYLGNGNFIHANHGAGVCIERLNAPLWAKRLAGFYRHRERIHG